MSERIITEPTGIDPEALYTVDEVADILRFDGTKDSRRNAVYRIPEEELPRSYVHRGKYGFRALGSDIIRYIEGRRVA